MSKLSCIILLIVLPTVLYAVDSPSGAPASTSSPTLAPTPSPFRTPPFPSSPTPSSTANPTPSSSPPPQQLSQPPRAQPPTKSAKSSSKGRTGGQKAGIVIGVLAATGLLVFGGMVYKIRRSNIQRARRAQMGSAARRTAL